MSCSMSALRCFTIFSLYRTSRVLSLRYGQRTVTSTSNAKRSPAAGNARSGGQGRRASKA